MISGMAELMDIQSVGGLAGGWLILDGFIHQALGWLSAEASGLVSWTTCVSPRRLAWLLHVELGFQEQKGKRFPGLCLHPICPVGRVSHTASPNSRGGK